MKYFDWMTYRIVLDWWMDLDGFISYFDYSMATRNGDWLKSSGGLIQHLLVAKSIDFSGLTQRICLEGQITFID